MALPSEDLINFDLIETHKENIQQLPGGRSAKQLAAILSPVPSAKTNGSLPTLDETKTLNDAIRQEYENELASIADSDDPLDIYDRYVKWTLNAYPSAQATPQSQLLPLLERATKTFLTSQDYKNDPRYLKLWLHYIRFFAEAPREIFAFVARHHIGEGLALFYEEFAAWLEGAGRWNQADEVYRMGIEKEARPAERLMRKYSQFQQRFEAQPQDGNEPSSPALPTVRPALAAKIDPFSAAPRADDQTAQRPASGGVNPNKPKKAKMAIFSDADDVTPPPTATGTRGWDNIGSLKDRKKENMVEATPWTGETLKGGKRVGVTPKMEVFKDPNAKSESKKHSTARAAEVANPKTGRSERAFVNMNAVYPDQGQEYSFEELRALRRGWMSVDWRTESRKPLRPSSGNATHRGTSAMSTENVDLENLSNSFQQKVDPNDSTELVSENTDSQPARQRKKKVREVKQQTQTIKTRLDSPTGRKPKRKGSTSEPTMTFHSKAATNDIYDMFNRPSKQDSSRENTQSGDDTDFGDDTYSTAGESVGTGRDNLSEFGDDTTKSFGPDSQPESVSPWSDFTASKHVPKVGSKNHHKQMESEDFTDTLDSTQNPTVSTGAFDTQAIALIANQDFGDLDTKMIAQLAGDDGEDEEDKREEEENDKQARSLDETTGFDRTDDQELKTPIVESFPDPEEVFEVKQEPRFIPLPPEDYEPSAMRPYRDPAVVAQNKLPFMTPIAERTESSLAPSTVFQKEYFNSKTPSRAGPSACEIQISPSKLQIDDLLSSSPQQGSPDVRKRRSCVNEHDEGRKPTDSPLKKHIPKPSITGQQGVPCPVEEQSKALVAAAEDILKPRPISRLVEKAAASKSHPIHKGPIVLDLQCNPCDPAVQQQIMKAVHPPVLSHKGYMEHLDEDFKFAKVLENFAKREKSLKSSPRRGDSPRSSTRSTPTIVKFRQATRVYAAKRQLGIGAFGQVYLVDSYDPSTEQSEVLEVDKSGAIGSTDGRGSLEALKVEAPVHSLHWEYHILHVVKSRLGVSSRGMKSIITAQECHLYRDECYLILDYHSQGTILELVNHVRQENNKAGKSVEGLEESVAMWFAVELLRTMEEIHKVGILHGDIKPDNCLVRFDPDVGLSGPYSRYGDDGWNSKGLMLIDFGRGIDTKAFKAEARFFADWEAQSTDCAEIREGRPWKWEIDLFGAAGIIHSLLFGKYIETIPVSGGGLGQKKEWKLKESLKRYWEKEIWAEVFHVLINGGGRDGDEIRRDVSRVSGLMEDWLEKEGERGGRDLRAGVKRCERLVAANARGRAR